MKIITNLNDSKSLQDMLAEFRRLKNLRSMEINRIAAIPSSDRDYTAVNQLEEDENHAAWLLAVLLDRMVA